MSKSYTVTLEERDGEIVMPIPDEIMEAGHLTLDDTLEFAVREDGSVLMSKQNLYLVKEHVIHEITYAVYAADIEGAKAKVENIAPHQPELSQRCVETAVIHVSKTTEAEVVELGQAEYATWSSDYILGKLTVGRGESIIVPAE